MQSLKGTTFSLAVSLVVMVVVMEIIMVAGQRKDTCAQCADDQLCLKLNPYEGNDNPGVICFVKNVGAVCDPDDKTQLCGGKLKCDNVTSACRKNVGADCDPDDPDDLCADLKVNLVCQDKKCTKGVYEKSKCTECAADGKLCFEYLKYDEDLNPGVDCYVKDVGDECDPNDETQLCGGKLKCDSVTSECRKNVGDDCDPEKDLCASENVNLVCKNKKCAKGSPTVEQEQQGNGFPRFLQKLLKALKKIRRRYRRGN